MARYKYTPYGKGGIGAELVNFFLRENSEPLGEGKYLPRTLHDFLDHCSRRYRDQHEYVGYQVRGFCQKLINENLLYSVGFDPTQSQPLNEQFVSYVVKDDLAEYGTYEYCVFGFPKIVEKFKPSVIKLIVKTHSCNSLETVGTGFLINNNRLVTAAHCLPANSTVTIEGWDSEKFPIKHIKTFGRINPSNILLPERDLVDLAIIEFEHDPFPQHFKFKLWGAGILDECLIMGYPSIDGFEIGLIAGTGQVVNEFYSYNRNQNMMLVDARVKGGNSGGPIINSAGKVIGVITNAESENEKGIDKIGYAIATPAQTLLDLIITIDKDAAVDMVQTEDLVSESDENIPIKVENTRELFSIQFQPKPENALWIIK